MAPQAPNATSPVPVAGELAYQVDDLIVDLGSQRVTRSGTAIALPPLSFDLLVALVRAAPNLISFEQLGERVWPGLVATPETIVQRVKLVRNALGDDSQAPRYIEAVRGRGYRMVAQVRLLTERPGASFESSRPTRDERDDETSSLHEGVAAPAAATSGSRPAPRNTHPSAGSAMGRLGWIGGALIVLALVTASLVIVRHRGESQPVERTRPVSAPAAIHSLVVLPLQNLSGDKEQEYFADGMTDALITDLAQVGSLRVISRTSAMHFKGSQETLPQIGRDLQVDAVVEGSVARGDGRVRITAQLVEARTDHHLWARTYERDLKDLLALQDEIARDITEQIRVNLTPQERRLHAQVHPVDPVAYDAALRGWYWWNQLTAEGARRALDYFQKAIAKDPGYALAYAGLANSYLSIADEEGHGELPRKEALDRARDAAVRALALDPSLAEAHTALANIKFWNDWDWPGAEYSFKQAISFNPNYATAHFRYAEYLVAMGRLAEARQEIERARDLDPLSARITWWLGQVLYHGRRYDDALRADRRGLEMHPDSSMFYYALAGVYEQKKMFAEALEANQRGWSLDNAPDAILRALSEAYKRSGYKGYLSKAAQIMEQGRGPHTTTSAAHVYALLADEPHAMAALEAGYKAHWYPILFMRTAPELDSIRSSPRFSDLVRRIGFPPSPSDRD